MSKEEATQKPQQSDKGADSKEQSQVQPQRKVSRERLTSDTQQGQSEADRQQAVQQSEKK